MPAALGMREAAAYVSVSPDFFREHVAPDLPIVRIGRRKLIRRVHLDAWLAEREGARGAAIRGGKAFPARPASPLVEPDREGAPQPRPIPDSDGGGLGADQ